MLAFTNTPAESCRCLEQLCECINVMRAVFIDVYDGGGEGVHGAHSERERKVELS